MLPKPYALDDAKPDQGGDTAPAGCKVRSTKVTPNSPGSCSGSEAGSYLRLIDSCITQLKAQGPSRTCNESKEEEEGSCEARAASEVRPPSTPESHRKIVSIENFDAMKFTTPHDLD